MMMIGENIMERLMRLKKCCCCMPLKKGALILASVGIIFSMGIFILTVVLLASDDYKFIGIHAPSKETCKFLTTLLMISTILDVIMRSFMIRGMMKAKPSLMFPSICMDFATMCFCIKLAFAIFAITGLIWIDYLTFFCLCIIISGIRFYFFSVNYSYYEDLRSQITEYSPGKEQEANASDSEV